MIKRSKPREHLGIVVKKHCRFCRDGGVNFDYKESKRLEKFLNERGKILSPRITGNCAKHQRKITVLIKRARFLALLPYVK
ncbi:MAG: 30S ribosomal protein S18 [Candidatus Omnitrophica bacterium CG11_big_fil_rev_8_21_14_0_20_42_13]|uniref:Small ribosomal subunit protein bS18 n=1 Tax=Candidatus Ghiorseimicrobium undicola TaxID=1974746 RepID=A0A2H0LZK5_9BACT|nr:MAG: 30S ribosomal protein S18 [Candidatus Omnitrophica bacterium CG11_big_fil_rev_8_21_14_0_20_42_13]